MIFSNMIEKFTWLLIARNTRMNIHYEYYYIIEKKRHEVSKNLRRTLCYSLLTIVYNEKYLKIYTILNFAIKFYMIIFFFYKFLYTYI